MTGECPACRIGEDGSWAAGIGCILEVALLDEVRSFTVEELHAECVEFLPAGISEVI